MHHYWTHFNSWEHLLQSSTEEEIQKEVENQHRFWTLAYCCWQQLQTFRVCRIHLKWNFIWFCLCWQLFKNLAIICSKVLLADEIHLQRVLKLLYWNFMKVREVEYEVHVFRFEVNALPSEFKSCRVCFTPRNHWKIYHRPVCVVDFQNSSVHYLQRLIQVSRRIWSFCSKFSVFFRTNFSIRAVLPHEVFCLEFRETSKSWKQDWPRKCYSYFSCIIDLLDVRSWRRKLINNLILLVRDFLLWVYTENRQLEFYLFLIVKLVS